MIFSFASNSTADYNCLFKKIHIKRLFYICKKYKDSTEEVKKKGLVATPSSLQGLFLRFLLALMQQ